MSRGAGRVVWFGHDPPRPACPTARTVLPVALLTSAGAGLVAAAVVGVAGTTEMAAAASAELLHESLALVLLVWLTGLRGGSVRSRRVR